MGCGTVIGGLVALAFVSVIVIAVALSHAIEEHDWAGAWRSLLAALIFALIFGLTVGTCSDLEESDCRTSEGGE